MSAFRIGDGVSWARVDSFTVSPVLCAIPSLYLCGSRMCTAIVISAHISRRNVKTRNVCMPRAHSVWTQNPLKITWIGEQASDQHHRMPYEYELCERWKWLWITSKRRPNENDSAKNECAKHINTTLVIMHKQEERNNNTASAIAITTTTSSGVAATTTTTTTTTISLGYGKTGKISRNECEAQSVSWMSGWVSGERASARLANENRVNGPHITHNKWVWGSFSFINRRRCTRVYLLLTLPSLFCVLLGPSREHAHTYIIWMALDIIWNLKATHMCVWL